MLRIDRRCTPVRCIDTCLMMRGLCSCSLDLTIQNGNPCIIIFKLSHWRDTAWYSSWKHFRKLIKFSWINDWGIMDLTLGMLVRWLSAIKLWLVKLGCWIWILYLNFIPSLYRLWNHGVFLWYISLFTFCVRNVRFLSLSYCLFWWMVMELLV